MRDRITESIYGEMPQQPVVVVAFLLCVGSALGWYVWLEWWELLLFGVLAVGSYLYSRQWWMGLLLVVYASLSMTMIHRLASGGDLSGDGYYVVDVEQESQDGLRGLLSVKARLNREQNEWQGVRGEIRYKADDSLVVERGDRLRVWCRVWCFSGRYYANLTERSLVSREPVSNRGYRWAERCNHWAMRRLQRLGLSSEAESLCGAMLLGRRDLLSEEVVTAHQRSGAAHVLALSGLHVMILYLVVSRLLWLLNLLSFGFRLRPIILALVVWSYAVIVGMSPSVERAAIMFVLLQMFGFFSQRYDTLSGLMITAAVMSLVDPSIIFDVGFLLSIVSVAAILVWVVPLDRRVTAWCRGYFGIFSGFVSALITTFMVGLACSVATLPLVSMSFGYISPLGVLLNPLVILLAYLLISLSLLWVLFGIELFAPLFRAVLDLVARVECGAVEYMSSGWRDAVEIRLGFGSVVAIYIIYVVATVVLMRQSKIEED